MRALLGLCLTLSCSSRGEVLFVEEVPEPIVVTVPSQRPVLPLVDGGAAVPRPAADVFVSAGTDHACALVGGVAYCWGDNARGRLGVGDEVERLSPTRVAGNLRFAALSVGYAHSCALDDIGGVHCWGDNDRGQLGTGDRDARFQPTQVGLPLRATRIAARFDRSCAIATDAGLYCWGDNAEGGVGQGDSYIPDEPEAADALAPLRVPLEAVRAVGVGQGHTCAVLLDGALYCWGRNSFRELGTGEQVQLRSPERVGSDGDWLDLALGQHHGCGLKSDDSLWCWGQNTAVEDEEGAPLATLGVTELRVPTRIGAGTDWVVVATDTFHTCAIDRSERLFCAGRNREGQLGLPGTDFVPEFERVAGSFARVSVGRFFSCAVNSDGFIVCAGANESGQLGSLDTERRDTFTEVQ